MEDGEVVGFVWDSAKKEQFITEQKAIAENMVGKTLGEMDQRHQSRFIRMREETNNPRDFPIVSPDGTFGGPKLNENGSPAKLAWGSYVTIDKALSIIKAGQANEHQVISDALGVMHKVRSFYNNIVDPQSRDGHVTMDTHAIAALFWEAMSGNSKAVSQNFGGAGSASSSVLGIKGLYPAFAEAYRTLAAELGLLPRQVQSITWEAIRMLFPAKWKSQKANVASVESVWDDYRHGEITQEQARERIFLLVQGRPIGSPEGVGRPDWAPLIHRVNNTDGPSGTADQGKISGDGRSGDGRPGRIGRPGLSGDAARVVRGPSDRGLTQDGAQYSLPSPPDAPGLFEKWFGNDKKLVSDTKLYEARNAIRAALEVPLFAGIDDNHTPGVPLEESIGSLTPDQRTALHDRVVSDLARMTGTAAEAGTYADELRGYLETVPELAGQRLVSPAALQYTNLVQAAAILSGIHGQTAAFSTILNTDNDQLQFDTGTTALLRSDLGRLLASQAGIGARIAAFARLMTTSNNAGLKRLGLTDETIAMLGNAVATKTLTANEIEALFAESTTSPQGPLIDGAIAKLQRLVDAAAARAVKPAESEIETLWRLMNEARGTQRGAAIAAALKAFMPNGPRNLSRANQTALANFRQQMQQRGGENLARSFWQLMSNTPRAEPGSLASFDAATQSMLADLLKRAVEKAGLAGDTTSIQPDAVAKLAMNLSQDPLRWDKIAAADEAVQAEIEAIEDPVRREALRAAWEDATSTMSYAIGGPALMRRALRDQMQNSPPNWKAAFDTGRPMQEAIAADRTAVVNAAMAKIDALLTSEAARANLPALRNEMEAAFNDIAAERYAGWLQGRERLAAQQKTNEARANFMAALQNRGVAEARLAKLAEALSDTPSWGRPGTANPVTALINAQMKQAAPDFVAQMGALGVTADVAGPLAALIEENRRRAAAIDPLTGKPAALVNSILSNAIGPLVPKLPIGKMVRAFMAAPAAHRNSAAWRQQQITAWLTENGIDAGLASRLTVSMDDMVASIMANLIYQEQEKYITAKKGVGTQAIANSEFAKKYQGNKDAIRSAIRVGLMTDGTPWQAWFSSVTGIRPLTTAEQSQIAAWETILSGDRYFPSEKGVAAAKLRDLLDSHFGKDVSGWEVLAASYDASALSSGTTMAIQFTGPLGKLASLLVTDMTSMIYQPTSAVDVMDSFLAAAETYAAELPNAFRYDTGGNFAADAAMNMGDVAPLKKDMAKQRAILANPNASMVAKSVAVVRFVRSAQDYLRQAMNAADSAAVAGFQRYFESREVRRIMRANKITKAEVAATMAADGFTTDAVELQADALGYDGTLKKRYVGDALWARWKEIVTAHANTPAEHQARMAALLAETEAEGEFSAFVGTRRDRSTPFDPTDWALGGIQWIGEGLFAHARKRVQTGEVASGSLERMFYRTMLGFVGIPLNAARASLWYSPFSLLSWANYAAWKKGIGYQQNPYERSLGNAIQVRQRMKETIMGNTLLLIAIAALKGLQEDEDWKINGYGPDPSKFPEEAKAWRRLHVPFTIEKTENGKAFNLPYQRGTLEPLKAPLMMLAGWTDAAMESKMRKEPAPELPNQIWGALRQLTLASITTGMRNIGGMRDAVQRGMDASTFGSQAGFIASPLVPYSGSLRWIRQWGQPEQLEKGFINNTPFATVLQDARPALNLFGQKLRPDPSPTELMSRQLSGLPPGYSRPISPADEKLHGWMQRTGKQPTAYSRLDVEKKILRTVTDDEWYAYSLAAGKVRYDQLMAAIDGTLPIERTVKMPGPQPDRKIKAPMKKGMADIDPEDKEAMKQAGAILEDIGAAAHLAGLEAIGEEPTPKAKGKKPPAPVIY
jgi:hypothetical protein